MWNPESTGMDPESTAWNPESKTLLDYLTWGDPSVHRAKALPLDHVEHTRRFLEFLLLKPSSLLKHEFKDIFQKNDCSLDSENPT